MKVLFLIIFLLPILGIASTHDFYEIYETDQGWIVDEFSASKGRLQDLKSSKVFEFKFQASEYAKNLNKLKSPADLVATEMGATPIWNVTNSWDLEWEKKYSQWVAQNFHKDFFKYYSIPTDCADVAYAFRWIFSRIHHLGAFATLAGSGLEFNEQMGKAEWANLPTHDNWFEDKKFLTALDWLLENVYTRTLYKDTYPVSINQETIIPGLINLLGAHTEVINKVSYDQKEVPIHIFSSTSPRIIRTLLGKSYLPKIPIDLKLGGLLRFRWPNVSKESMPYYSLEQYDPALCSDQPHFALCIFKKININFNPKNIIDGLIDGLKAAIFQRIEVVETGINYCRRNPCGPGTQGYEDWGTHSRDKRISSELYEGLWLARDLDQVKYFQNTIEAFIIPTVGQSLSDTLMRLGSGLASSDPEDSFEQRWASSARGVLTNVTKKLKNFDKAREIKIQDAQVCRNDVDLCRTSELFELHSTAEIDNKARVLGEHWVKFCSKNDCEIQNRNKLINLWLRSPIPWESEELRRGESAEIPQLIEASSLEQVSSSKFILDRSRVYDVIKKRVLNFGVPVKSAFFHKTSKTFWINTQDKVMVFDENINKLHELEFSSEVLFNSTSVNHVLLYASDQNKVKIVDSQSFEVSSDLDVGRMISFSPEVSLFSDKLITTINDDVAVIEIDQSHSLSSAMKLKNSHVMALGGSILYRVDKNGLEVVKRLRSSGQMEELPGGHLKVTNYMPAYDVIFDKNLNEVFNSSDFHLSFNVDSSRTLLSGIRPGTSNLLSGDFLSPVDILRNDVALSANADWITTGDQEEVSKLINWSGEVLFESKYIYKLNCHNMMSYRGCAGGDLLVEHFHFGASSFNKVGIRNGIESVTTLGFTGLSMGRSTTPPVVQNHPTIQVGDQIYLIYPRLRLNEVMGSQ